jgi:hypothetical protein
MESAQWGYVQGQAVEVLGLAADGFPASYSCGRLTEIQEGIPMSKAVVSYDDVSLGLRPAE